MFTVTGTDPDGVGYTVTVDGPPVTARIGVAAGSLNALELLAVNEGRRVRATPTGDEVALDPFDPAAVLAGLYALTRVHTVEGDAPDLFTPRPAEDEDEDEDEESDPLPDDAVF